MESSEREHKLDRKTFLAELKSLRDEWNDEIPEQIVDSTSGTQTKYRKQWFQNVISWIEMALDCGLLSEAVSQELEDLDQYLNQSGFRDRPTTPEDITKTTQLLNCAISELESSAGVQILEVKE